MEKNSVRKIFLALGAVLLWTACEKEDDTQTRSFYMGFTPFPYEMSETAATYTYTRLNADADIVNHHFDNGVPWAEALAGEAFPQNVTDDWSYRKSQSNPAHKIYVSATPLNFSRTGLALYRGTSDNMALAAPWDAYDFNDEPVKKAYLNYCKRLIDFFQPDYFNMAIEANLLHVNNAARWTSYLQLHDYIYTQLKATYPELPIFSSVSGAYLLKGFFEGNDHVLQRLAVLQLLEHSDLYALSYYPYLTSYLGNAWPENALAELFNLSPKPLAMAETGYAAQTFSIQAGGGLATIESDADKQEKYIRELLDACAKRKAVFVINFVLRDYDKLWEQIGSPTDVNIAWRDAGLIDENGETRKAYGLWKEFLARHVEP